MFKEVASVITTLLLTSPVILFAWGLQSFLNRLIAEDREVFRDYPSGFVIDLTKQS